MNPMNKYKHSTAHLRFSQTWRENLLCLDLDLAPLFHDLVDRSVPHIELGACPDNACDDLVTRKRHDCC